MGRIAVKDPAASEGLEEVVIADREWERVQNVVALVPQGCSKVSIARCGVTDHGSLAGILRGPTASWTPCSTSTSR